MSINIGTNIGYQGNDFLDSRSSVEHLDDLKNYSLLIPEGFEVFCKEDGFWYKYNSEITDEITGHFIKRANAEYSGSVIEEKDLEIKEKYDDFIDKAFPYCFLKNSANDNTKFFEIGQTDCVLNYFAWISRQGTALNERMSYSQSARFQFPDNSLEVRGYIDSRLAFTVDLGHDSIVGVNNHPLGPSVGSPNQKTLEVRLYVDGVLSARDYVQLIWQYRYVYGCVPGNLMGDMTNTDFVQSLYSNNFTSKGFNMVSGEFPATYYYFEFSEAVGRYPVCIIPIDGINIKDTYNLPDYYKVTLNGQETSSYTIYKHKLMTDGGKLLDHFCFVMDYPLHSADKYSKLMIKLI